jgi:tripartite-type tricarboxylate transporter receptor subunit TctC
MMRFVSFGIAAGIATVSIIAAPHNAAAQTPAEFYKGKTVELLVGYSAGGAYDVYARLIARHIGKHIPGNPAVVVKNVEGAGSLRLTNSLYNALPKDGTVFGAIGRGTAFDPLFGSTAAQFEATKFGWIGSANNEVSVCAAWHTSGITRLEDTYTKELVVGGDGPSNDTDQFPRLTNGVLGTKMRLVSGYPGGNEISLAMERGEVQGRCGWSWSSIKATRMDWYEQKKIHILVQLALEKHADLPDIPLIMDLAKSPEQKQIFSLIFSRQVLGRPYLAPPGLPPDRLAALRKAFMDTMSDPELLAEAEKAKLEITPVAGAKIQQVVADAYKVDLALAKKAAQLLQPESK